jgi:hypothetical protein
MDMTMFDFLVLFVIMFYFNHITKLMFSKEERQKINITNSKIDELRKIPNKTLEQQKEYINLKYPKKPKFKWSWIFIFKMLYFMLIYYIFFKLFILQPIRFTLGTMLMFVIIFPLIMNYLLAKIKWHNDDTLNYMLKWK